MIRRYLLDTGIAQDFQADRHGIRARALAERRLGHRIGICTPVLGELWSGVECSATRERNLQRLMHALSQFVIWPYTNEAAEEFGRLFAELRRVGRPMQQIDIQIGAIPRTLPRCTIVSSDTDMLAIPGVTVENWAV
jgi:tRNA(fMet)-specific endonuclease VapC